MHAAGALLGLAVAAPLLGLRFLLQPRQAEGFRRVEALAAERGIGRDLDALEALWQEVKRAE